MLDSIFNFLRSVITPDNSSQEETAAPPSQEPPRAPSQAPLPVTTNCPQNTFVYIWQMTADGVGHVGIQVGDLPKVNPEDKGTYRSIHPQSFPAIGPTIVLPLDARLATTLKEDMQIQAETKKSASDIVNDLELSQLSNSGHTPDYLPPDWTYQLHGLDTNAMLDYMRQTDEDVATGKTAYQLAPGLNVVGFFSDSGSLASYDPVDATLLRVQHESNKEREVTPENCATLVGKILTAGGLKINQSFSPWKLSPNSLAKQLDDVPQHGNFQEPRLF